MADELLEEGVSRKNFVLHAAAIAAIKDKDERKKHAQLAADVYSQQNKNFSYDKFYNACGVNEEAAPVEPVITEDAKPKYVDSYRSLLTRISKNYK